MIREIIFDMDGLMIDTEHLYWDAGRERAGEGGKTVSDQTLRKMMGRDRLASSRIFVEETGVPLPADEVMVRREEKCSSVSAAAGSSRCQGCARSCNASLVDSDLALRPVRRA